MTNNEFQILKAGQDGIGKRQDDIMTRLDRLPCSEHLDRISTVETRLNGDDRYEDRELVKRGISLKKTGIAVSVGIVIATLITALVMLQFGG